MNNEINARLFRHMGWANQAVLRLLRDLPDSTLQLSAWNADWTVGKIMHHIVIAEGRLIARIDNESAPIESETPVSAIQLDDLIKLSADFDIEFSRVINSPEQTHYFNRYGKDMHAFTSTILAQAIHHAAEHRAQIADILAVNNLDVLNLDKIDLWSFERFELRQSEQN
jgi:uncharacterized damage-inducible protein DinB